MMKILGMLCGVALAMASMGTLAWGQALNAPADWYFASDYGQWDIVSTAPGQYTWPGTSTCQIPKRGGGSFFAFTAGTPVFVRDALNPTHNEVVTVSSAVNTSSSCGFTGALAYTHTSFNVLSATGGLQEAINVLSGGTQSSQAGIVLNRNWYQLLTGLPNYTSVTPATILGALTGNANVYIVDTTTASWTFYTWSGSAYTSNGGSAAPTLALSTGAGTTPTKVAIAGNGSSGTVSFVSGTTPTASATIFTLTWPAVGGFNHAPTCTITSVGSTAYTSGTTASVYTPPAKETFTASATALTAATAYAFAYSCQ